MTGELTLTGRVLPIGGLKEKILGAVRAGITDIILPKENEADLEDIPEEVAETLTFHCVEDLDSVISIALVDESGAKRGKAKGGSGKVKNGKGKSSTSRARKKNPEKEIQA
jgi:ATP-dependent Lon protease